MTAKILSLNLFLLHIFISVHIVFNGVIVYALFLNILKASFFDYHNGKVEASWNRLHIKALKQLNSLRSLFSFILLRILFILYKTQLVIFIVSPTITISLVVRDQNEITTQSNTFNKNFLGVVKISINTARLSRSVISKQILTQIVFLFKRIIGLLDLAKKIAPNYQLLFFGYDCTETFGKDSTGFFL